jgi:hypothetical protein
MQMRLATSFAVVVALTFAGGLAQAKPTIKKLQGQWFGDLRIAVPDKDDQKMPALLAFAKDGSMRSKIGPVEKPGHFKIDGKSIVFFDENKKKEATLVNVKLTKKALTGELKPTQEVPGGVKVYLELQRRAAPSPKPKSPH